MGMTIEKYILAIVTMNADQVKSSGTPIFFAKSEEELQRTAFLLEKILDGIAHDLENGTLIIVRH
ncbi:capping complex subunit for YIEGIA [Tepidibacillus sp. LV47]|uniref:capping complex subunit for YIEGIA n=1 Tax=Tepidibacillus sp. LV47 TaxID=3398228 RepID=UPI003AB0025E